MLKWNHLSVMSHKKESSYILPKHLALMIRALLLLCKSSRWENVIGLCLKTITLRLKQREYTVTWGQGGDLSLWHHYYHNFFKNSITLITLSKISKVWRAKTSNVYDAYVVRCAWVQWSLLKGFFISCVCWLEMFAPHHTLLIICATRHS